MFNSLEELLSSSLYNKLMKANGLSLVKYKNCKGETCSFLGHFENINQDLLRRYAIVFKKYKEEKFYSIAPADIKAILILKKYPNLAKAIADYDYHDSPYLINPTFTMRVVYDYTNNYFGLADKDGANQQLPIQHSREMLESGPWWRYDEPILPFQLFKDEIKGEIDKLEEDQIPSFMRKLNKKLKEYL
jgi:hypothetical protein